MFLVSRVHAQGPENTMLVVNAESPDSLAVANLYVSLRNIPATNVVYLNGVVEAKDGESISSGAFKSQILKPILHAIKDRGLESQIDCVTYSSGFPTRMNFKPEMTKYLKQKGKKYDIHYHAPFASISSLTYFHKNFTSDQPDFLELDANHFASLRSSKILQNPFKGKAAKQYAAAEAFIEEKNYSDAADILFQLAKQYYDQVPVVYALARVLALKGEEDKAIEMIAYAHSRGLAYRSLVEKDSAFASIRSEEKFRTVLAKMEDLPEGILPTRGFSSRSYWSEGGWPSASGDQGKSYMLSTVLALNGKNQSTLAQALEQLERSVAADGTSPAGDVYFAKHNDPRSKTRQPQFKFAVTELKSIGRSAKLTGQTAPQNEKQIVGATLGSSVVDWGKSGSQFVPGALCDNFTSYGAWWAKTGQTQLTDFLNAGAAAASGTIYEPYTIHPKIPNARLHAHYARGCTVAEAFYQSVSGPFQLLIVGDPLCCPFGKFPKFEVTGLEKDTVVKGDFELQIEADADSPQVRHYEMYFDGVYFLKVSKARKFLVETDGMTDGFHEIRIVAVADSPVANRASRRLEFVLDRDGRSVFLNAKSTKIRLGQSLELSVESSSRGTVEVRQNSRNVATLANGKNTSVPAAKLGRGRSRLHAIVALEDGSIVRSSPLAIEVSP